MLEHNFERAPYSADMRDFTCLYRRYVSEARRTVAGVLRMAGYWNVDDREEIVQTVFSRLFLRTRGRGVCGASSVGAYIGTAARNATYDWIKVRRREIVRSDVLELAVLAADSSALDHDVDDLEAVRAYVGSLTCELAKLFVLRFSDGLSQAVVCSRLSMTRQRLRTIELKLKKGALKAVVQARREQTRLSESSSESSLRPGSRGCGAD